MVPARVQPDHPAAFVQLEADERLLLHVHDVVDPDDPEAVPFKEEAGIDLPNSKVNKLIVSGEPAGSIPAVKRSANTEWTLFQGITRIPESEAPNVRNGNLRAEITAEVPEYVDGVIFAMGGYAGGVSLYAINGELYYEYSALLLKRDKIKVGKLPAGKVKIAFEMRTPLERAAPAELKFWINGKEAAGGTVQRTVPLTFTASETFDVGRDTMSPVADDYFEKAPFPFEGELGKLHFKNLLDEKPAFERSPDDD